MEGSSAFVSFFDLYTNSNNFKVSIGHSQSPEVVYLWLHDGFIDCFIGKGFSGCSVPSCWASSNGRDLVCSSWLDQPCGARQIRTVKGRVGEPFALFFIFVIVYLHHALFSCIGRHWDKESSPRLWGLDRLLSHSLPLTGRMGYTVISSDQLNLRVCYYLIS